jgi:hypothetical protein
MLGNGKSLKLDVTTSICPVDAPDDTPDIGMPVVMALQTNLLVTGGDGRYSIECTYGSQMGEKIQGEFKDGIPVTLNLQPGDYEIVINHGSDNGVAGQPTELAGNG